MCSCPVWHRAVPTRTSNCPPPPLARALEAAQTRRTLILIGYLTRMILYRRIERTTRTVIDELREEDDEKGRDEIVDALNVTAGRMAYRPYIQNALEDLRRI